MFRPPFAPRRFLALLIGAALGLPAPARAAEPPLTPEQARVRVEEEVAPLPNEKERIERAVVIAFVREGTTPELRDAARRFILDFDARLIVDRTLGFYDSLPPERQVELLQVFDHCYPDMKGYDFRLNALIGRAVAGGDREVRRTASAIAARYKVREAYFPLRKRSNRSSGEDRIEAIRSVGEMADGRAVWFLPDLMKAHEPGVAEAAIESLGHLGRTASVYLKEEIISGSPERSLLALRTLMTMPAIDDLPAYYGYVQGHDVQEPLKTELYNLIARLEVARDKGLESPRD